MNQELPKDRLATTDAIGRRVYLYPAAVRGYFQRQRVWVHTVLMLLFLALPWIYWNGKQVVLLNVADREFFLFGLHFRAHDAPLLLFVFLSFVLLLGLVTALWGRLWCGWACPQTVFTEHLFRRLERWIEGGPRERRLLDEAPLSGAKLAKKSLKWVLFLLISLLFTHSFLAYFVGSRELLAMISGPPEDNWPSFLVILFTTALVLFDFGWFREQFCVIVCPYGRFQSVMLDNKSLVVAYDQARGEPRRGTPSAAEKSGDCVNCFRCVQVCPTGIDIRRGLQMECIACTACIDACDEVMEKTKKPKGLIRYTSLVAGEKFNARAIIYGLLLAASLIGLSFSLRQKDFLEVTMLRAAGAPYELSSPGQVTNHFRLDISNQTGATQTMRFSLEGEPGMQLIFPLNPLQVPDGGSQRVDFFVQFPSGLLKAGQARAKLHMDSQEKKEMELPLVGPDA